MDFYKLIKSLDELVFEILSWLYFYPRTLLRALFRPYGLMADTEKQMEEDDEPAWGDRIGPPLFLALTLGLIHVVELLVEPENAADTYSNAQVAAFMADDKNLLGFRIILFGCLPLLAAGRELTQRGVRISKSSLKAPFYAQCYAAAGFAVLFNGAVFAGQGISASGNDAAIAVALFGGIAVALLWIGWVETRWFHGTLQVSRARALWHSSVVLFLWVAILIGLSIAMA